MTVYYKHRYRTYSVDTGTG